ncbi:MAG: protein-disulfide reductase DsbD family protein [Rhodospirillales bacterium]|nr:protein-disulfide reductase DsbD family protein [Rhodospirillales bacterium]
MTQQTVLRRVVRTASLLAFAVGLAIIPMGNTSANEGASDWFVTQQNKVRLISATQGLGEGKTVQLGLQFKLQKGWKVYWRTPGDAGFPPRMDWTQSVNLGTVKFNWPAPTRFEVLGFQTLGYKNEVVFPIVANARDPNEPLKLRAKLHYLTCDDVCIPYQTELSLELPVGHGRATDHFQLINKFTAQVPGDGANHGLTIEKVETAGAFNTVEKDVRNGTIRVVATSAVPFTKPDIFVEGPELAFFSPPDVSLENGGKRAVLILPASEEEDTKIQNATLTLTLVDGGRATTQNHPVGTGPPLSANPSRLPVSLPFILTLAVLGGLILNLMPCVLPVISLKMLGIVSHGGADTRVIRKSFLASSLGILFSFLVIASVLMGLKFAGAAIGWGIQFQHPWFIVGLTVIVSLFAYNLWGLFNVTLPTWLSTLAGRQAGSTDSHESFASNFGTGAFATLLATPCSAPFLGTSVGFALAGTTLEIYAVFAALGVGMALPFLTISLFPSVAGTLPRPGAWMVKVKYALGVALAATAAWLISVLAVQLTVSAAATVGALMMALGITLVCRRHLAQHWRMSATAAILAIVVAAFAAPYQFSPSVDLSAKSESHWVAFEPEKIPRLVAEGKTVFVDVTAEWCITCQVNKAAVLNWGDIHDVLAGGGTMVAMKGDWTRPDAKITAYLKSFGRFGIPFNAVYGPASKNGIVLPELLTTGLVWDALGTASGGTIVARKNSK